MESWGVVNTKNGRFVDLAGILLIKFQFKQCEEVNVSPKPDSQCRSFSWHFLFIKGLLNWWLSVQIKQKMGVVPLCFPFLTTVHNKGISSNEGKNVPDLWRLHLKNKIKNTPDFYNASLEEEGEEIQLLCRAGGKQASEWARACTNNLDFHQGNSHIEW